MTRPPIPAEGDRNRRTRGRRIGLLRHSPSADRRDVELLQALVVTAEVGDESASQPGCRRPPFGDQRAGALGSLAELGFGRRLRGPTSPERSGRSCWFFLTATIMRFQAAMKSGNDVVVGMLPLLSTAWLTFVPPWTTQGRVAATEGHSFSSGSSAYMAHLLSCRNRSAVRSSQAGLCS